MRSQPSRSARSVKTQYFIAAVIPALIVVLSISGFVWAQKQVTVVVDGRISHVSTQATSVARLLDQADVALGAGDIVIPPGDAVVSGGMTVVVRHATPVILNLGGNRTALVVVGQTVADALFAAGIDPDTNPAVTPALSTRLERDMTIWVPDVFARITKQEIALPFAERTVGDPLLPVGVRKVLTRGHQGTELRVFRALVSDGIEGSATLSAVKSVAPAVDQVVAVGTATRVASYAAIVASARALARVRTTRTPRPGVGRGMQVEATGYSAGSGGADHRCATGALATHGVIAVDPRVIPLGTHVFVPGYGYAVAADTGGAIKGHRIDLCYDSGRDAILWGRRTVTIIILD